MDVAEIDGAGRRRKHHGSRLQVLRRCTWEISWIEWSFRDRHIARGGNELCELRIGHLMCFDPKTIDGDLVDRPIFGVMTLGTHRVRLVRHPAEILSHVLPVNTVDQSFFMLTTVQFCWSAISSARSAPAV